MPLYRQEPARLRCQLVTPPLHDSAHVLIAADCLTADWTLRLCAPLVQRCAGSPFDAPPAAPPATAATAATAAAAAAAAATAQSACPPYRSSHPAIASLASPRSSVSSLLFSSLLFPPLFRPFPSFLFVCRQFILYNDPRDAEHATRTLDGTELRGKPIRVEISTKGPREKGGAREGRGDDRGGPRSYEDRPPRSYGGSGSGSSGGSSGAPCYICHQPGHIAAFCPSNAPPPSSRGSAPPYPPSSYPPAGAGAGAGGYAPYPPRGDYRGGSGRRSRSRSPRSRFSSGGGGGRRERSRSRSGSRSPRRDYREVRRSDRPPPAEYRRDDRPDDRRDSRGDDRRGNGGDRRREERPPVDDREYRSDRRGDLGSVGAPPPPPPPADDRPEHNDLGDLDAQA